MPIDFFDNLESLGSVRATINSDFDQLDDRLVLAENKIAELQAALADSNYHEGATPFQTSSATWVDLDNFQWILDGGVYDFSFLCYFSGSSITRDFMIRILLDGQPFSEEFSKEPKDPDDNMAYSTFRRIGRVPGTVTATLQGMVPGGGTATLTINSFRAKCQRVYQQNP